MKIAVIGKGKTGAEVLRLAREKHDIELFDSKRVPTVENLFDCDVAVIFVPAGAFTDITPVLIEAKIPVVAGTTGVDWTKFEDLDAPWIVGSNFSRGMNLMFTLTKLLGEFQKSQKLGSLKIHEVHHTEKKDSPSGTALHLQRLLPSGTPITAERLGDVKGEHTVELFLPGERLEIHHEALGREVFAAGALWAVEKLLPQLANGVHSFESLMEQEIRRELYV